MRPQSKQTSRTRRLTLAGLAAMTLGTSAMPVAAAEPAPATSLRLPTLAPADQPASPQAVNRPVPMPPITTPQASGDGEPTWSTEPPAWLSPTPSSAWNPPTSQWKSPESEQKPLGLEWRPPASGSSTPASEWTPTNLTWQPEDEDSVPVDEVIGALDSEGTPTDTKTVPLNEYQELLDRVTTLEDSWTEQEEKAEKAAEAAAKKSSWKLSGRVHLDNWNFLDTDPGANFLETGDVNDDPEDRWDFRRIRIELAGRVPANMLFRTQIDFNNPSSAEMKDVYLGFDGLPHNQTLLIGNQKRPIGMDHLNSSRHNVFAERPLAVETFNEDARRLGVCMYGYTDDEMINWRYGAFILENISRDGRYRGDFDEGGLYARLAASPWYDDVSGGRGYYHCAIIGSVNQTDADGTLDADDNANEARFRTRPLARSDSRWWNTNRILGADGYQQLGVESVLNIGALQITGEYFGNWVQRDPLGGFNGEDLTFHGGYIFASYFLTGEHIPLNRRAGVIDRVRPFENFFVVDRCCGGTGKGWGALAMAFRYDYLDLSDSDIRGGQGYACTFGLNWYWTAYSKLQTNLVWGQIENGGQGQSTTPLAAGVDADFTILGMRYMIDY